MFARSRFVAATPRRCRGHGGCLRRVDRAVRAAARTAKDYRMEIRKIIVAMDEDDVSTKALEEAMPLARKVGAEIILTHVGELYESYPHIDMFAPEAAEAYAELLGSRHQAMRSQLAEIRERHLGQGVEISISLIPGIPEKAIPAAEDELGADLIVVGSHGRTGFRRLLSGSVSERIVRRSSKTVLVARNENINLPYRRVLVATDFSPAADAALETALQFAAKDAEITLFHSWELPSAASGTNPLLGKLAQTIEAQSKKNLDEIVRRFEGDFVLRQDITYGHPAPLLRERAAESDLIALGSHGRKGVSRFVLGSVAELTVRHAPCSVLVAHGPEFA